MQNPHPMPDSKQLVTAEELERMPDDDFRYELVQGRIVRMSPVGGVHGGLTAGFIALLVQHVKAARIGAVATELGFILARNPDTVRAPDVAFINRERIPAGGLPKGFWIGAPDLAVEVLSPDDRLSDVLTKVDEYLTYGTGLVLVVDPDEQTVSAHRRALPPLTFGLDDTLDLDDVVPGFSCRVREIFQ
jgi:Uma2 family endonuclease